MILPRSPLVRLIDNCTGLVVILVVVGLFFGAVGALALNVICWLAGLPT